MDAYTRSGDDLDAILKGHALLNTLDNLDVTTHNIGGITLDLKLASDKATHDYLTPKTPWQKIGTALWDGYSLAGWVARH